MDTINKVELNYKPDETKLIESANVWRELRAKIEDDNYLVYFDAIVPSLQFVRFKVKKSGFYPKYVRYYFSNNMFRAGYSNKSDTRITSQNINDIIDFLKK